MKPILIIAMLLIAATAGAGEEWTATDRTSTLVMREFCQTYFTFDPKEDITAYELAHAMMFIDWYRSKGGMYWIYNQLEESDLGDNPAKRHFTWHGCEK